MFRPVQEEEEEEEEEEGVVSPVLLLCNRPSERLSVSLSATCTGRLLDEVVFLSPARPHSVEVAGGGGEDLPARSPMDPAWLGASSQSPAFITERRASGGQLKPRVVLYLYFLDSPAHIQREMSSPPRGLLLAVPSHFSSELAYQISWSFPVFVSK